MNAKHTFLLLQALMILAGCADESSNAPESSNYVQGTHFEFMLFDRLSSSVIPPISDRLEANYERITRDLQVSQMPKVKVKIWSDAENFLAAMQRDIGTRYPGATGYVAGLDDFRLLNVGNLPQTAVHEFAHVVSLHVNNRFGNNPRWLWESVAVYESGEFVDPRTLPYMVSGSYPTLSELNTDYNSSDQKVYSVGYTILEYIVQTWGMNSVIYLIQTNGDIRTVLGISTQEFENGWYQFVRTKYL